MIIQRQIESLNYLHRLILERSTGTPHQLGKKLGMNERNVREYIGVLRDLGADITYNRKINSYEYVTHPQTVLTFPSPLPEISRTL